VWICRPIRQLRSLGRVFQLAPGTPRSPDHPRHDQFKALSPSFPTVDQHEMRYDEIFDSYVISFSVHILACSLDGATSPKFLILKFIIWGDTNYKQAARGRHPGVSEFTNPKTIPNGLHSPRTCVNWSPFSSSKNYRSTCGVRLKFWNSVSFDCFPGADAEKLLKWGLKGMLLPFS